MLKIVKITGRLLVLLFLLLTATAIATGIYCYHYRDQIIQKFVCAVNKRLDHPIQVRSIQLNALKSFPNITFVLQEVVVKNRTKATTDLVAVRKVYCAFDLWKLFQGQYVLDQISLEQGKINLAVVAAYQLGQEGDSAPSSLVSSSLTIKLQKLTLKDIEIVYGGKDKHYTINVAQSQATLQWGYPKLEVELIGVTTRQSIQHKDLAWAQNLPIALRATLTYNQQYETITLQPIQFKQAGAQLVVQGSWGTEETAPIHMTIQGKKISSTSLLQCFPLQHSRQLQHYIPQGNLGFALNLTKEPGKNQTIALQGSFVLKEGRWTTNYLAQPINLHEVIGELCIPRIQDLKTAMLKVNKFTGTLADSQVEGSLLLHDFQKLHLQGSAQATVDLASLNQLLTKSPIVDAAGQLNLTCKLEASLAELMHGTPSQDNIHLVGELQAQAAQFKLASSQLQCRDLNGHLFFQNDALVMKNFTGSIGPGNFVLNGTVQNLLPFLLVDDQKLCSDAKLYVDTLDLDALFADSGELKDQASRGPKKFNIAPHWMLNLDCDIQQLRCKRFYAKNVRGKLKIKDQKLIAEKLQLGFSGGKAFLYGSLDASTDHLAIHTKAQLKDVDIDQLFYGFENFHQSFLIDKHLSGKVFADLDLSLQANKQWDVNWEALQADIDVRLSNGALHRFAPIQQLYKYVAEESLSEVHFSELGNYIRIKHRTIHIPPMEVHSNVTRIRLSGTHTFDGKIDYNFVIPLTSFRQVGHSCPEEVAADALAGINLFLKLRGDVNNYQITYDTEAFEASLKGKIQEQGQVLKQILQGKYKGKTKVKKLAPDDYFEFE